MLELTGLFRVTSKSGHASRNLTRGRSGPCPLVEWLAGSRRGWGKEQVTGDTRVDRPSCARASGHSTLSDFRATASASGVGGTRSNSPGKMDNDPDIFANKNLKYAFKSS